MLEKKLRSIICITCRGQATEYAYEPCLVCGVGICQTCAAKDCGFCKKCLKELPKFIESREGALAFLRDTLKVGNLEDIMKALQQPFILMYHRNINGSDWYAIEGVETKEKLENSLKARLLQGERIEYLFFNGKIQKYKIAKFELEFFQ